MIPRARAPRVPPRSARWLAACFAGLACAGCAATHEAVALPPASAPVLLVVHAQARAVGAASSMPDSRDPTPETAAPTWTTLYAEYFAAGRQGGCAAGTCHAAQMGDAAAAYAWLRQRGYIAGTQSPLVSPTNSCLRWFGGNMPPRGEPNPRAAREISAWVSAGARDD
jgi:hypothetical protein